MNEILKTEVTNETSQKEGTITLNRSDYEQLVSERDEYRSIALAFSERYEAIKEKIGGA